MFLSLHIGFSLGNAAVVCAILLRKSGFEPFSVIMYTHVFENREGLQLSAIDPDISVDAIDVDGNQLVLLCTHFHAI